MRLEVIAGSTRPTRAADKVAPWVLSRASLHEAFETELIDLRDWPLPMFGEHIGSVGDPRDPTSSAAAVRRRDRKIPEAAAYRTLPPAADPGIPGAPTDARHGVCRPVALRSQPLR